MFKVLATLVLSLACTATLAAGPDLDFADIENLPETDTLVIPVRENGALPQLADTRLSSHLKKAMQTADFKGKKGEYLEVFPTSGHDRVVIVGLGEPLPDARALQEFGGAVAGITGDYDTMVRIAWTGIVADTPRPGAQIALGLKLGGYRFDKYRASDEDAAGAPARYTIHSLDPEANRRDWEEHWSAVAKGVWFARDLISEPANAVYPESFVERTREAFGDLDGVDITVLDPDDMAQLGMGALLGVGMGSERPPRLLVIEYLGGEPGTAPVAFVGKGVTFDTGGISLKSPRGLWRMKYDMSGAAAVTGTVLALASRQAPVNAVAIAALVENMPSERAQRPGDVRKSMSGKTIEVINTDAEGRLILSDALWYAQEQFAPAVVVNLATLTGSIRVALGSAYAGVFSRHDALVAQLQAAGRSAGEELWRMPLHESFRDAIKSDIADVKNSVEGGYGGASTGAEFVGTFVKQDTVWAHMDIAGTAWQFEGNSTTPKGAAGWGVRLLNQWVMDYREAATEE